jgi:hypothetical protein
MSWWRSTVLFGQSDDRAYATSRQREMARQGQPHGLSQKISFGFKNKVDVLI